MNDAKYIGLDVHQATISVAVRDSVGKLVMEAVLETKAEAISTYVCSKRISPRRSESRKPQRHPDPVLIAKSFR